MILKLPKKPRLHTFDVCTNDHKEFNGAEIIGEPLAIGVKNPKSKINTYIVKEGYTYLWETYKLYGGDNFYSIWLLYPKDKRPIEIEIEDYMKNELIDAIIFENKIREKYVSEAKKEIENQNIQVEYTLTEVIGLIENGDFYVPVEEHPLLKRMYMESNSIQFEFYPNVTHVGLGINKDMKFRKLDFTKGDKCEMTINKPLNYNELNDLRGQKVWDNRYSCWVTILHGGDCCIPYKYDDGSKGEIYRGDEGERFLLKEVK